MAGAAIALAAFIGILYVQRHKDERPERYAFVVGIGDANFPYPPNSARAIANVFEEQLHIPARNTVLITGSPTDLTETGILASLDQLLRRMPKNGTLFLYVGGHGFSDKGQPRWALAQESLNPPTYQTLTFSHLDQHLGEANVENIFGFYELCRVSFTPYTILPTTQKRQPLVRQSKPTKLQRWVSFFSSSEGQISLTTPDGHSYFSQAIEAALRGGAADQQGVISYNDMFEFVQTRVWSEIRLNWDFNQWPTAYFRLGTKDSSNYELTRITPVVAQPALNYHDEMLVAYRLWLAHKDKQAMEAFRSAGYFNTTKSQCWTEMAAIAYLHHDYSQAIEYQREAVKREPRALPREKLGQCLMAAKRYEEAHQNFKQSIALAPRWPVSYSSDAAALSALNRPQEAKTQLLRAIALAPNWPEPYHQLTLLLLKQPKPDELGKVLQTALHDFPDDPVLMTYLAAYTWKFQKNSAAAIPIFRKVISKWPDYQEGHLEFARCLKDLGRTREAQQQMDMANHSKKNQSQK